MGSDPTSSANPSGVDEQVALNELRELLIGPEQKALAALKATLNDPTRHAEAVSRVLPEAVVIASRRDQRFGRALAPSVETALKESIQRNPLPIADAIFPIIGPAIRRSIAAMFRELTQSLNRTLEHSLSIQGLRWRAEAWRTGKSFAEVVMFHTLVYRVEQVLLIHNDTSLLLAEVHGAKTETRDADQISAMLAAIQDFMRDSFRTERQAGLNTVEFGELTLWLEHGPHATLVAAIRGHAPESLRPALQQAVEEIHATLAPALQTFSGDNAPFSRIVPDLERCLLTQHGDGPTIEAPNGPKSNRKAWVLLGTASLILALWIGGTRWRTHAWRQFEADLARTPGVLLTDTSHRGGVWTFRGMRDPLAASPAEILRRHDLPTHQARFEFSPFWSLSPELILKRATHRLGPPVGVTLRLEQETLIAEGSAPAGWAERSRPVALALPGVSAWDASRLQDSLAQRLIETQQRVEAHVIYFSDGVTPVNTAPAWDLLAAEVQELLSAARAANRTIVVELLGHTDRQGTPETNQRLGWQRAQVVMTSLLERGIAAKNLRAISRSTADASAEPANARDRRVTMRVEPQAP